MARDKASTPLLKRIRNLMPSPQTIRRNITPKTVCIAVDLLIIVVAGAILFMCLVGMIKFTEKTIKDKWIEITSQILNTCFTLNALLLAPGRTKDFWLTANVLRGGKPAQQAAKKLEKRNSEWLRILPRDPEEPLPKRVWVSVILLHNANGWFQIPMALSMWIWATDYTHRPAWLVASSLVSSFMCGIIAGLWQARLTVQLKTRRKAAVEDLDVDDVVKQTPDDPNDIRNPPTDIPADGEIPHADSNSALVAKSNESADHLEKGLLTLEVVT